MESHGALGVTCRQQLAVRPSKPVKSIFASDASVQTEPTPASDTAFAVAVMPVSHPADKSSPLHSGRGILLLLLLILPGRLFLRARVTLRAPVIHHADVPFHRVFGFCVFAVVLSWFVSMRFPDFPTM